MGVLPQHFIENGLPQIGYGRDADIVDEIVPEIIAHALNDERGDDGHGHHGPDVVNGGGQKILQIDGVPKQRDGEQRDQRIGRCGIEHAVENRGDQNGRKALRGSHHDHQDH